ncbi:unnamed protein product [Caenorhabditis brenneri]
MWKNFAVLVVFIGFTAATKTICTADEVGPSIKGTCPPGYKPTTNSLCCPEGSIEKHSCKDQLDSNGDSMCLISRAGCGKLLISQREEADLCPETCGFCVPHGVCADLNLPFSVPVKYCTDDRKGDCNSTDETTKKFMKTQCPKLCGYCGYGY